MTSTFCFLSLLAVVTASGDCVWAEGENAMDEQLYVDFLIATIACLLGVLFTDFNARFLKYLGGGHKSYFKSFHRVLHVAFISQIMILGFMSFTSYFLYQFGFFYVVKGDTASGNGPYTETSMFIEVGFINSTIFFAIILYYISSYVFVLIVNRNVAHLREYSKSARSKYTDAKVQVPMTQPPGAKHADEFARLREMEIFYDTWVTQHKVLHRLSDLPSLSFTEYMVSVFILKIFYCIDS
jgi:hypothetical protein